MIECSICKSHNQETAVFCADCGQRLHSDTNSNFKLNSPLLDSHATEANVSPLDQSFPELPTSRPPAQPVRPGSTPQNGLHSPLLDAWNTRPPMDENLNNPRSKSKPAPDLFSELSGGHSTVIPPRPDPGPAINKSSRLHSPVLDGPGMTNRGFEPEDLDMPVEEYNSLRSPLLAAKVPLPEAVKPSAEPAKVPPPANPAPSKQPTIQSLFGIGAQQSPSEESYKQFASSLFEPSPKETGERPAARSQRQTGHFSKVAGVKKEETTDISVKQSLLPEQRGLEQSPPVETGKSGLFKVLSFLLLLASLAFKFWYWQVLGAALWASQAFLFDQIGQILVILLLLVVIFTAKF